MVFNFCLDYIFYPFCSNTAPDRSPALGERYFALGNRSVKLNIFLLNRIVFNKVSYVLSSDVCAYVETVASSGKNFLTSDSIIGSDNI